MWQGDGRDSPLTRSGSPCTRTPTKISPRRTATGPFAHCIVARSATISIFADLPHPPDEITLTTSGGIIRGLYRHSTSGLYTELSEWARGKFGCLLSDAGLMLAQTQASRLVRIHLIMTAAILTLLVGVSRIYLGVHYPSDVLAGWCFGIAWALTCQMLMSYFQRTGRIEQPSD